MTDGYREFGADELQRFLSELDAELQRNQTTPFTHLVVVGSAILLKAIPGRATGDIDVISESLTPEVRQAVRNVGAQHGLRPDWINDGARALGISLGIEMETIYRGRRLLVQSASPRPILAMKLLAHRPKDREDAIHLIRELDIGSVDDLFILMQSGLQPSQRPSPTMESWAEEVFAASRIGLRRWRWQQRWLKARHARRLRSERRER